MAWNVKRGQEDIVLNGVRMMLDRRRDGTLVYEEEPVEFVPERFTDADVRYSNLPPEEGAAKALTSFGGGIGRRVEPAEEQGEVYYGYPYDVTGDGAIVNAPLVTSIALPVTTAIKGFFELGGALYAIGSRYALKKDAGDAFTTSRDFGAGQTAKAAEVFRGTQSAEYAFVALGSESSHNVFEVFDGTTWTAHASLKADYFRRYRSEMHRIFFTSGVGWQVEKTSNGGTASTWGSAVTIGDAGGQATGLEVFGDTLFVARSDGLFDVTKETTPDDADLLGGFVKSRRSANNGVGTFAWKDYLFYPTNDGGLYCRMGDGTTFEMGPSFLPENRSPIRGRVLALAGDDNWLYATVYNAQQSETYLMKARVTGYAEGTSRPRFGWYGAIVVWTGGVTVDALAVSGVGGSNPRLYMGRSDSRVDYYALPRQGTDPKQDAADGGDCRATATSVVYLPEVAAGFVNHTKSWLGDRVETEGASSTVYVDEEYRTADAGAWTSLGRFSADDQAEIEFGNASSRRLQRRLTLTTGASTSFVAVRSVVLTYVLRFPDKARFSFVVDAEKGGARLDGGAEQRADPEDVVTAIRNAKAAADAVTLTTPYGTQYDVYVRRWKRVNKTAEHARAFGWLIPVVCVAKAATGELGVYDVSLYDGGAVYS